ncbi:hypothetical protein GMW39_10440 [Pectobacterium parmentieri]|uniref:Uncharacterized protein n=1 Tax=Pectobacterium quasiaquaticum TaxID=2774015 RepID=A0A9Q2EVT5_9GAMM|nr:MULTISPECIES: hypothetical protein [Pectobacterium]QHQ16246.1 hypothetical protein GMW39_10440 [Pectobacterium parmentieri]URG50626.1 hypothetical protein IG609_009065 [Pectobacterium quasiaquaticum]
MGIVSIIKSFFTKVPAQKQKWNCTGETLDDFILREIKASNMIKTSCRDVVFQHLSGGVKLHCDDEIINTLTDEGIKYSKKNKDVFIHIRGIANTKFNITNQQIRFKSSGIEKYRISAGADGRDCAWCKKMHKKKFYSNVDFVELIEGNCTCFTHCRITLIALIKGVDYK